MITKISAKSADKYTALFQKATELLKEKAPEKMQERFDDANSNLPEGETSFTWDILVLVL